MKIKNLERASELYDDYSALREARGIISHDNVTISVLGDDKGVALPQSMKYNVLQVINLEINKIEKEVGEL